MENDLKTIDVAALDAPHRRALEEVIGRELATNQQLIISVIEVAVPTASSQRPAQTLDDWTQVYDGLNEDEIESADKLAKSRAELSRDLP